ncbi:MAG: GNAT family N-acetyltransferase [Myxococcaceae bacterium]|jgi:CelD/BcsL family acetyltransferase involved in cellulose biosynthesis|nr:GNAT family N-acetyltransferase [Myxococcaceae bacterium]
MNVFTTPQFLETAGAVFFPAKRRELVVFRVDGRLLRLLVVDGRVVETMPFYDYPQPLDAWRGPVTERWFFPRSVVRTIEVPERTGPEPVGLQPSPYVDWSRFSDEAAFQAHVAASAQVKANDAARQRRRVERELGPLEFRWHDERPEVFTACVRWKSSQYRETGVGDMFADERNVELFRRLVASGVVKVASLFAGSTLIAAHFGAHTDRRFAWWVPAYDPAQAKFSPGRLLLLELLRESQRLGDLEFDFLIGDEKYKFGFATHNRVIGPIGAPPVSRLVSALAKKQVKAWLERHPAALQRARALKQRFGV